MIQISKINKILLQPKHHTYKFIEEYKTSLISELEDDNQIQNKYFFSDLTEIKNKSDGDFLKENFSNDKMVYRINNRKEVAILVCGRNIVFYSYGDLDDFRILFVKLTNLNQKEVFIADYWENYYSQLLVREVKKFTKEHLGITDRSTNHIVPTNASVYFKETIPIPFSDRQNEVATVICNTHLNALKEKFNVEQLASTTVTSSESEPKVDAELEKLLEEIF